MWFCERPLQNGKIKCLNKRGVCLSRRGSGFSSEPREIVKEAEPTETPLLKQKKEGMCIWLPLW